MTQEDFLKVEELKIIKPCYVLGKAKKPGDVVKLSGNAKIQLKASKRAEVVEKKTGGDK
jgi:hypothetical protein